MGLPWWFTGKEYTYQPGDESSTPGSGRSPGDENGNPLQDSCQGNSTGLAGYSPHSPERVSHNLVTDFFLPTSLWQSDFLLK